MSMRMNSYEQQKVNKWMRTMSRRDAEDRLRELRMEQNGELDENGMPIEVEVVVDEQFYGWYDDIV